MFNDSYYYRNLLVDKIRNKLRDQSIDDGKAQIKTDLEETILDGTSLRWYLFILISFFIWNFFMFLTGSLLGLFEGMSEGLANIKIIELTPSVINILAYGIDLPIALFCVCGLFALIELRRLHSSKNEYPWKKSNESITHLK